MDLIGNVLAGYGFEIKNSSIENFGNGLINDTWLVESGSARFILQSINTAVFREPLLISDNLEKIGNYLQKEKADYFFTSPMKTLNGESMIEVNGEYYRAFPFVKGSRSVDIVETPDQAYEAARQFGKFTKVLSGIDIETINTTLPHFHDLFLRYQQFTNAIKENRSDRLNSALDVVQVLQSHSDIVSEYEKIKQSSQFKQRVTHHDTKISNVLFDSNDTGICVIDLDTVMPGYFISDVGDMMRTYLSPVSEEEKNFDKIEIRNDFYFAIAKGYLEYMGDELSEYEKKHFFYSGKFIIYMQALRFLTDHLNGDTYYGARYPLHNYVRAKNQATLLQKLIEKEPELSFSNIGIF